MYSEFVGKIVKVTFQSDHALKVFEGIYLGESLVGKSFTKTGHFMYGRFRGKDSNNKVQVINLDEFKNYITQDGMLPAKTTAEFSQIMRNFYIQNEKNKQKTIKIDVDLLWENYLALITNKENALIVSIPSKTNSKRFALVECFGYYFLDNGLDYTNTYLKKLPRFFMTKETVLQDLKSIGAIPIKIAKQWDSSFLTYEQRTNIYERITRINKYVRVETLPIDTHEDFYQSILGYLYQWTDPESSPNSLEAFLYSNVFPKTIFIGHLAKTVNISLDYLDKSVLYTRDMVNPLLKEKFYYGVDGDEEFFESFFNATHGEFVSIPFGTIKQAYETQRHFDYLPKALLDYICNPVPYKERVSRVAQELKQEGIKLTEDLLREMPKLVFQGVSSKQLLDTFTKTSTEMSFTEKEFTKDAFNMDDFSKEFKANFRELVFNDGLEGIFDFENIIYAIEQYQQSVKEIGVEKAKEKLSGVIKANSGYRIFRPYQLTKREQEVLESVPTGVFKLKNSQFNILIKCHELFSDYIIPFGVEIIL